MRLKAEILSFYVTDKSCKKFYATMGLLHTKTSKRLCNVVAQSKVFFYFLGSGLRN